MGRSVVTNARWRAVALVAALAAAVWLVVLLGMPEEADARSRFRTVTKTFSNPTAITINQAGSALPYPSALAAGGMRRGKILDVNVTLNGYSHTFPDDVDVMLVGPGGQNLIIMSDVGETADTNNITLTLDDEAASFLPDGNGVVSGTFKPTDHDFNEFSFSDNFPSAPAPSGAFVLSTFDGTNPNGLWSLYVHDDLGPDGGQFAGGWSLQIKAKVRR